MAWSSRDFDGDSRRMRSQEGEADAAQAVRMRIAAQIRRLRAVRHMSQEGLAQRAGLAVRHVQKIEAGEVNVTVATLVVMAICLGVDVATLFLDPKESSDS